jgi:hypothetical protein
MNKNFLETYYIKVYIVYPNINYTYKVDNKEKKKKKEPNPTLYRKIWWDWVLHKHAKHTWGLVTSQKYV